MIEILLIALILSLSYFTKMLKHIKELEDKQKINLKIWFRLSSIKKP